MPHDRRAALLAGWVCGTCHLTGTAATETEAAYLAEVHDTTLHGGAPNARSAVDGERDRDDLPGGVGDAYVGDQVLAMSGSAEDGQQARAFVARLSRWRGMPPDAVDRVVQVTGELLSHQVRLGRTPSSVSWRDLGDDSVRVSIHLDSCDVLHASNPPQAESRRRLVLLNSLADRWGVEAEGYGASWWFVVAP